MFKAFKYILYFDGVIENDSVRNIISEIEEFRKEGLNLYDSGFEAKMYTLLEESLLSKQNFLDSFNDKNFEVNYIKVKNGVFYCQLEHNIKFSKLYSSYAINKVFNNKVISEQKLFVLYPLVAVKALTDILKGDFTRKYVVDYVMDIASKERKNNKLLNYINNDTLKEKLILKLNYADFNKDKDKVYNLTRNGFKIALNIDKDFKLKEEESKLVKLFYFIFTSDEEVYNKFNDKLNIIYMPEKREI